MSPTHINSKLPPEILGEIFLTYIQTVKPEHIHRSRSDLSLVCRHWRQITESHARLWSTIYIRRQDSWELCPPTSVVSLFLKRSMNLPLEIHLLCNIPPEDFDDSQWHADYMYARAVFSLLTSQAFRWQRIVIGLESDFVDDIQRIDFSKAEQLEHVSVEAEPSTIRDDHNHDGRVSVAVLSALANAPNLRSFGWLGGLDWQMRRFGAIFPLERLTRLHLGCQLSISELLQVMQKCTSVVEMSIGTAADYIGSDSSRGPFSPAVLPNLRTLILRFPVAEYNIFEYFDFPNLEIISIVSRDCLEGHDVGDNDITPLLYYLSNSRHCVQVLLVRDHLLRLDGLATFLSDPVVSGIPIVQICTTPKLRSHVREEILKAVETGLPNTQQAKFEISPVKSKRQWRDSTLMGWTDGFTYKKFKDCLAVKYDGALYCTLRPQTTY